MQKSLRTYTLYFLFSIFTTHASSDKDSLYLIEVFNKDTNKGHVVIVLETTTWEDLKTAMKAKNNIEIENKIVFPSITHWTLGIPRIKTKEKIPPSNAQHNTFEKIIGNEKPISYYANFFDTGGFKAVQETTYYQRGKSIVSQIKKIPDSEAIHQTIFAKGEDGTLQLMSMDQYHEVRKKNLKAQPAQKEKKKDKENTRKKDIPQTTETTEQNPTDSLSLVVTAAPIVLFTITWLVVPLANRKTKKNKKNHPVTPQLTTITHQTKAKEPPT